MGNLQIILSFGRKAVASPQIFYPSCAYDARRNPLVFVSGVHIRNTVVIIIC
jgi:hypothetical protein